MNVKFWGVRGSLPAPLAPQTIELRVKRLFEKFFNNGFSSANDVEGFLQTLQPHEFGGFGGNSPCIEVSASDQSIIIDGGSGIRNAGHQLLLGPCGQGKGTVHILMTHFHWDHLIGLPFFIPIFIPGNVIHFYAPHKDLEERIKAMFRKPFFPVRFEDLPAKVEFHQISGRQPHEIRGMTVTPYGLDHPDPCWGYRISHEGKTLAHCVDTEGLRVSREAMGPDLPLYQNVDLMIFDAQYTLVESIRKLYWGHSSAAVGFDIAMREQIKQVIFMHHDPASSDERIREAIVEAEQYYESQRGALMRMGIDPPSLHWSFAQEGMTVTV